MKAEADVEHGVKSVLFAMEDATVAHAFARILEAEGHTTAVAESLEDAEAFAGYDVLVAEMAPRSELHRCDDGRPGGSGLDFVEHLRGLGLAFDAVLVASEPTADDYRRALRLGVLDVLERPLRPEDLIASIDACGRRVGDTVPVEAPTVLHLVLGALEGSSEAAAREVVGWSARCEVTPAIRARVATAIAEIVQNAIDHGAREVDLLAHVHGRHLDVEIVDDGPGFDVISSWTEGCVDASSGLGRAQALSDDLVIQSDRESGTRVRMRFGITSLDFDLDHQIDLSDLDYFSPATAKELLATLADDPDAPIVLSPALAVVVGRLLAGPDPRRVLQSALWS